MHDPLTQAFQINQFWRKKNEWGYRPPLLTIWHRDPERGGSDDSCDWFGRKLTKAEDVAAAELIDNEYDNLRTFFSTFIPQECPKHGSNHEDCDVNDRACKWGEFADNCDRDEMKSRVRCIFACYKRRFRWRYPVRWHFWHWRIQIHPLQNFKRWAFSRCCKCGKGFSWGYSPVSGSWYGTGPLWFRSEQHTYHADCDRPSDLCVSAIAPRDGQEGKDDPKQ